MSKFADIHCHPSLHPFAYDYVGKKKNENVWDEDRPKVKQRKSAFPEYTQSDFRTMARGGVKLAFVSIYPIEQGWFNPKVFGEGNVADLLARIISKLPIQFVNEVQSDEFRYYDFFFKEYHYLNEEDSMPHDVDGEVYRYIIIKPGDDIDVILNSENTIGVIMTVEGAQSFVAADAEMIDNENFNLDQTLSHIEAIKTWDHPPFFVSLSHHFNNGFCGHARSFPGIAAKMLDQTLHLDDELNDKGRMLIDCLLGIGDYEGNGQRILIDTKHMSIKARSEYYDKISAFNERKGDADKIPIVVSHTGYSGHETMEDAARVPDSDEKYKSSGIFNNWSINLCDDEIIHIFNSNGIMGLNFDERILSGKAVMDDYDEKFKKKEIKKRSIELQKFWAQQMLNNILGIVNVVVNSGQLAEPAKVRIWDMLAIGTDFDGMINAEDAFITAEEFIDFRNVLEEIIPLQDNIGHLLQGLSVEQALDKIMYENAYNFAMTYYMNP